jgi:hypothetical protein
MARPMIKHDTWLVGSSDGSSDDENLTFLIKAPMDRLLIKAPLADNKTNT